MSSPYVALPPLVAPPVPVEERRPARPAVVAIVTFVALAATLTAIGWGFTQWSSAKDWKHRSQQTEAKFDDLQTRVTNAEDRAVTAERTNARTRRSLVRTEQKLAKTANQLAFTHDLRVAICEALPGLSNGDRARICP